MIRGIDLSQSNANLNYHTLHRLGYDFAILRDGFGWGNLGKKDLRLNTHYKGVKDAGMQTGFYHYIYSLDAYGAAQEAKETLEHIKGKDVDLFIACDIEEKNQVDLSNRVLTDMVISFSNVIRDAGYIPAVYSMASLLNRLQWERIPDDVLVWAAHWGVDKPAVNHKVDCWQNEVIGNGALSSLKGILPGAGGDIDVNILYDTQSTEQPYDVWKERYEHLSEQIIQLAENCIVGGI